MGTIPQLRKLIDQGITIGLQQFVNDYKPKMERDAQQSEEKYYNDYSSWADGYRLYDLKNIHTITGFAYSRSAELLFIQVLQIVQGLLGGKSQQPVGVTLEGSQVIEGGRLFRFVAALHLFDRHICTLTGGFQLLGGGFVRHALPGKGKTGQFQRDCVEWNRLEGVDLGFPLDDERQRWRHDAPDVEGTVVQHGKQSCGVDTHQPVRLGAAESRIPQAVIVRTGAQVRKALPDGGILHRGNPEPLHGFLASRQLIDAAEN